MKKILSKIMIAFMLVSGAGLVAEVVAPTHGNVAMAKCTSTPGDKVISSNCDNSVKFINSKIYNFAATIAGIVLGVAVVMITYAGFKYATSQGDPKQTETAKMQIIAAGIGIFIVMLAFVILNMFKTVIG